MYSLDRIDGNAFAIIGYVRGAMKKEKKSTEEITLYIKEAMSNNYDNLLCVSQDVLDKLNGEE